MRNKIAEIRLAPGQVGFYDELTNIHLTLTKPFAFVYQGMNTSGLQRSVNSRRLSLVWGSLKPAPIKADEAFVTPAKPVTVEQVKAPIIQEPVIEEIKEVEAPVVVEEAPVIEEAPIVEEVKEAPKKSTKKSSKKKEEVKEEE